MNPESGCKIDNTPNLQLSPEERKARVEASMRGVSACEREAKTMQTVARAEAADQKSPEVCRDIIRMQLEIANCDLPNFAGEPADTAILQLTDMLARMMRREGLNPEQQTGFIKSVVDNLRQLQGNQHMAFTVKAINAIERSRSALTYTQTASL